MLAFSFLSCLLVTPSLSFLVSPSFPKPTLLHSAGNGDYPSVQVNEFFKQPVYDYFPFIAAALSIKSDNDSSSPQQDFNVLGLLQAPPGNPGIPRPVWLVCLGSIPTGLAWYGYYKFAVEEELLALELEAGKVPRGFGGYGTLGPFTYGLLLGPVAALLHLPGGIQWTALGVAYIYYTQFLLYDRVNELYREIKEEEPLEVWWCLPIFFPFNLIVGLRQVHYLSQYWYRQRGVKEPPIDPVAYFFPFIAAPKFTWQEFLTTPSLWCVLLKNEDALDRSKLPEPVQSFLKIGEDKK